MRKRAKRALTAFAILLLFVAAFLLLVELYVSNQQSEFRGKYDAIEMGMRLAEAEAILDTEPEPFSVDSQVTLIVAHKTSNREPPDTWVQYYPGSRCGVLLRYDPQTKTVSGKEFWIYRYPRNPVKILKYCIDTVRHLIS